MVKAIARAFRRREMIENGEYATIREIAIAEKINESYVGRVLRLTLLAPDIVETILGGGSRRDRWRVDAAVSSGWREQVDNFSLPQSNCVNEAWCWHNSA